MIIRLKTLLSEIHDKEFINKTLSEFNNQLESAALHRGIRFVSEKSKKQADLEVWYVKSGGVENYFAEQFDKEQRFYFLLTTDKHNSLPAALEIHSYITQQGSKAEILHGSAEDIADRLYQITKVKMTLEKLKDTRIGVIGRPSDWLIASEVDYQKVEQRLGIELIDIDLNEVYSIWKEIDEATVKTAYNKHRAIKAYNQQEVTRANTVYKVLKIIINKYNLQALTIRCFDLVVNNYGTGCLALSFLNSENIVAGCEGDIPAVISMLLLNKLSDQPVFMANPARINADKNEVVMAHCTLPWNMAANVELDTHFETRQGIGVRGQIPLGQATVFKMSNNMDDYFISPASILSNGQENSLCRTQITMKLAESTDYFLKKPYGNHHLICCGDYTEMVKLFFEMKGDREIC